MKKGRYTLNGYEIKFLCFHFIICFQKIKHEVKPTKLDEE